MSQGLTVTMTRLGAYSSVARAVPLSSATGSLDFVTLNHGIGQTPTHVWAQLRSVVNGGASAGAPQATIASYNQTAIVARLDELLGAAATSGQYDIFATFQHSIVR